MEPISTVLFSLFRGSPRHGDWVVACLEGAWPAIVGEGIARVCQPASCAGATLIVSVTDAAWEKVLTSMKDELQAKIRLATGGEVQELSFVLREGT
jgi:predicted nucleic acid-binding Zn ribbon protein